jgi:hypothetical protein
LTASKRSVQLLFAIGVVGGLLNRGVFGPWTVKYDQIIIFVQFDIVFLMNRLMNQRFSLERDEGKQHNEPGVSDRMKALNKQFGIAHGCSMLINMVIALALVVYPFFITAIVV